MNKLPILEKNAYLTIVVKDNAIWSHLAYVDYSSEVQYILSDYTDISHLKRRLDDYLFMETFWNDYFSLLQRNFGWEMLENLDKNLNRIIQFKDENYGLSGIKVLVDDNQDFLTNIFHSISQYSHDISVRVMDIPHMRKLIGRFAESMEYKTLLYMDLDINSFQIYRVDRNSQEKTSGNKLPTEYRYSEMSQQWSNEIALIDSIKDRKLEAFLACDVDNSNLQNNWANLILHPVDVLLDYNLIDILRSYTTVQLLSILTNNKGKLTGIGDGSSAIVIGGKIPRLLGKKTTLLSIIDGLELHGNFDVIWDDKSEILAYGISASEGVQSSDIVIGKNEIISGITKVFIPELKSKKARNKVIFSATARSQDYDTDTHITLGDTFEMLDIKNKINKVVFEGKFENNVYLPSLDAGKTTFVSSPLGIKYDNVLVDSRLRPIIYGTDRYKNKLKIKKWLNAD
jgi:hypothetical protein